MRSKMYLDTNEFAKEVDNLKVYGGSFTEMDAEKLNYTRLLKPRLRLRYPENIARRIYFETRGMGETPIGPLEPDGQQWDIACELHQSLFRYDNYIAYCQTPHPFSRADNRYKGLLESAEELPFANKETFTIDVSSDKYPVLKSRSHVQHYYSSWQVPLAAEVADSGMHYCLNWHIDSVTDKMVQVAFEKGKIPNVPTTRSIVFAHAIKEFKKHQSVLDAATTLEEKSSIHCHLLHKYKGSRFTPTADDILLQQKFDAQTASECAKEFNISAVSLVDAIRYFLDRWLHWSRNSRPSFCAAYENLVSIAIKLSMHFLREDYTSIKFRLESDSAHRVSILDEMWPDWLAENKEKTLLTLREALKDFPHVIESDLVKFAEFVSQNGLETFFWRLSSFEEHALRGNAFWTSGMSAEIQGMAVVVEHLSRRLMQLNFAPKLKDDNDLLKQFKRIFGSNSVIVSMLKNNAVTKPAVGAKGSTSDWLLLRSHLASLRSQGKDAAIVADLLTARYVRGAVHYKFPEVEQFESSEIFVSLMRASFFCFFECKQKEN